VSRKNGGWCQVYHTAQHGVQVTPLARPQTCGVFGISRVPSLVAVKKPASGAPDAQRWAAPQPQITVMQIKKIYTTLWW